MPEMAHAKGPLAGHGGLSSTDLTHFFCIKLMLYVFVLPQVWVTPSQDFPMDFTASLENPCPTQQPATPP